MSVEAARILLNRLLDRHERPGERTLAIREKAPPTFDGADEHESFTTLLRAAEREGAVSVAMGRGETRHLIASATLVDAGRLYAFLQRRPRAILVETAASFLMEAPPSTKEGLEAARTLADGWRRGVSPWGLSYEDPNEARAFLRALDGAVSKPDGDCTDLRTWSRRTTGDSKLIERMRRRIVACLRALAMPGMEAATDDEEAFRALGLEKFPHPVLVAGPVRAGGIDARGAVYVGIPPDSADDLVATDPVRSILTIENLASFNRHVREIGAREEIVLYTGGFPSKAVTHAIRALAATSHAPFFHWGDIDAGGVRIAACVEREVFGRFSLHLMEPDLARTRGTPCAPMENLRCGPESAISPLVAFLCSDDAHTLEQEETDPLSPEGP